MTMMTKTPDLNSTDSIERMFTRFAAFCLFLVGVVVGVMIALTATGVTTTPDCPTEDSCSVSYDNNQWTITEDN